MMKTQAAAEGLKPAALAAKESAQPHAPPTRARSTVESTVADPTREFPARQKHQPEEVTSNVDYENAATTGTSPKPSLFPPSLKYTPPSASTQPHPPTTTTPAPATAVHLHLPESKPANPKLEDLYHIYLDSEGFEYKLILLRSNPYLNNFARYDLRMYESHTMPHFYCTVARYIPPAGAKTATASTSTAQISTQLPTQTATPLPPSAQLDQALHPSATHLKALVTSPLPSPSTPYRTAIAPPNSPFQDAFRAFRHAFRDLTLLSWHERLADPSLQRLRAQAFCIEPFVWRRPAEGLPMGFSPPAWAPLDEQADVHLEEYTRNAWGLPALDEPLGIGGAIGIALLREAEEVRRKEEEKKKVEERRVAVERARKKKGGGVAQTKIVPQYYEPQQVQEVVAGRGGGGANGGSRASTPGMPAERKGRAIIMDFRTAQQKRFDSFGKRLDY